MKHSKYYSESYLKKQKEKNDRNFGEVKDHKKICQKCEQEFIWTGRLKTKQFEAARFCSQNCANFRGVGTEWENIIGKKITKYRTIAFSQFCLPKKCEICNFDKIVEVHHIDEDRTNNKIDNLIILCPNHHQMYHSSKWKEEMLLLIKNVIKNRGIGIVG